MITLLSKINVNDTVLQKIEDLTNNKGLTILDIVKSDPHLLLGFPEAIPIITAEGEDDKQNIEMIEERYYQLKDKLLEEIKKGKGTAQLGKAIQLLRQARYHMLEGSNTQRESFVELGKKLNNLLKSNGNLEEFKRDVKANFGPEFYEQVLVAALLNYYYDIARKLGHIFEEGTFVVYDDTGNIFRFLSNLTGAEHRDASHLNSLAKTEGYDWLTQTGKNFFGFPVNLSKSEGKGTVLFNRIDKDGRAVFIKPEHAGLETWTAYGHHALGFAASLARKSLPTYVTEAAGLKGDDHADYSKERVPQYIRDEYRALIGQAKEAGLNEQSATQMLQYDNFKGMGIQKILPEVRKLEEYVPETVQTFIDKINQNAESQDPVTHAKYTHLDKRFGHEVILTDEEFNQYQ